ncbi:DUF3097 domain-containing protein [Homoserinimonas sp. OAct 916]|uniref:DUF3097 domain-containing protein n=1 Tax=Homoserinimonas sp. OAct 916 TaxID=2211450 RepID=UPI000DBE6993|nr:DUF3097 domain-containing protein [Homoserinimonas sp. OAct 916]
MNDRYDTDPLATNWRHPAVAPVRSVEAVPGLVVEELRTDFCGAVIRTEVGTVSLEDRFGKVRVFPLGGGFLLEGEPVTLIRARTTPQGRARTASGSLAVADTRARVARASRIFVEGRHDAELVEKVWGADLRIEGVVVEYLGGIDDLAALIAEFNPGPGRRVGVLVDHLVPGSKETRIAEHVARGPFGANVLVVGHPYVDVWQAVKPARLGLEQWPAIPRSIEWKRGICQALGWPGESQTDIAHAWQRILSRVDTFADLEPALLGRVEQLIDFVTE